jgi:hypothetical protein
VKERGGGGGGIESVDLTLGAIGLMTQVGTEREKGKARLENLLSMFHTQGDRLRKARLENLQQTNQLSKTIANLFSNLTARSEGCCRISSCNRSRQTTQRWCVMGGSHRAASVLKSLMLSHHHNGALMLCQR